MVISITVSSIIRSYIKYTQMPSPVHQYVINWTVNIQCGNTILLKTTFFDLTQSITLTTRSLIFSYKYILYQIIIIFSCSLHKIDQIPVIILRRNDPSHNRLCPQLQHGHSEQYYTSEKSEIYGTHYH